MWGCNYLPFSGRWGPGFFPGGFLHLIIWGLIIFLLAYLVIRIVKRQDKASELPKDRIDSLAILKARFAKGEITQEEFIKMKKILLQE